MPTEAAGVLRDGWCRERPAGSIERRTDEPAPARERRSRRRGYKHIRPNRSV